MLTDEIGDTLPSARTPDSDHRQARLRESIERAVDALPDRQRLVFVMRQYEDLGNEEIAAVLQCPVGTVKANYFFAVRKMREALAEWV